MSKYTIEMRYLIAADYDFGLKDYPIFDETYRPLLNAKILEHFKMREIGFETEELFKEYLNRTMTEIMPLYNQYYAAALIKFDPFQTYNLTTQTTGNSTSNNENTTNNTGSNTQAVINDDLAVSSNTPAKMLEIADIKNNTYATNATHTNDNDTVNNTATSEINANGTATNINEYASHVFGTDSARTNASILKDFRTSFINIDMLVINDNEIQELFMGVY